MGKRLTKTETIIVDFDDPTRLMERASKRAIDSALFRFGIDDCGHANKVKGWNRSSCSIRIKFEGMEMNGGMMGWQYVVRFSAWCEESDNE